MDIIVGSDEKTALVAAVIAELADRGHHITVIGPPGGQPHADWVDVGRSTAEAVVTGSADQGICLCWTGTGVSMAANRVPGARAALCTDAETAAGARRWNDANILVLSNRLTSPQVAREILAAWFTADPDPGQAPAVTRLDQLGPQQELGPDAAPGSSFWR